MEWSRQPADTAPTTGRQVLLFEPGTWSRVAPLAARYVARGRARPDHDPSLVFDETGHAIVQNMPAATLAHLRRHHPLRVRNEVILQRPATAVASAPQVFLDDRTRSWVLQALGLPRDARDGQGIQIGLLDSGVDLQHPALQGAVVVGTHDGGLDTSGHGTHCAGLLVGRAADGAVRFGIAPGAVVWSYRIFDESQRADEGDVRQMIQRAVLDGCRVLVLAAGVPARSFFPEDATLGQWLAARGCLLFGAAGNESNRLGGLVKPTLAPANAPHIRAIGAITAGSRLWNASNGVGKDQATRVDAVAPGIDVLSAWPGGRTLHMSGTSVATAIAGGVAAALWSRRPTQSAAALYTELQRRANRRVAGAGDGLGAGALVLGPPDGSPSTSHAVSGPPVPLPTTPERSPAAMSETTSSSTSILELLDGVARLLDQRPDLRARVIMVDLARNGANGSPNGGATDGTTTFTPSGVMLTPKFNLAGHAVIAYMAEQDLEQNDRDSYEKLQRVKAADPIGRGDIGSMAIWPDQLKHPPAGQGPAFAAQKARLGGDRGHWHYVNIAYDPSHRNKPVDLASASGDLLKQLPGQLDLVASADPLNAADALCFVLHLMGDLHQPLHCAALADGQYFKTPPEYDQGGNLIRWGKDIPRTSENLHALWDDFIAVSSADVEKRVQELLAKYPRHAFTTAELNRGLDDIALESFGIAKDAYDQFLAEATYLGESTSQPGAQQFSPPSPKYRADGQSLIRRRAALAAYRLADILRQHLPGGGGPPAPGKKPRRPRKNPPLPR